MREMRVSYPRETQFEEAMKYLTRAMLALKGSSLNEEEAAKLYEMLLQLQVYTVARS